MFPKKFRLLLPVSSIRYVFDIAPLLRLSKVSTGSDRVRGLRFALLSYHAHRDDGPCCEVTAVDFRADRENRIGHRRWVISTINSVTWRRKISLEVVWYFSNFLNSSKKLWEKFFPKIRAYKFNVMFKVLHLNWKCSRVAIFTICESEAKIYPAVTWSLYYYWRNLFYSLRIPHSPFSGFLPFSLDTVLTNRNVSSRES